MSRTNIVKGENDIFMKMYFFILFFGKGWGCRAPSHTNPITNRAVV